WPARLDSRRAGWFGVRAQVLQRRWLDATAIAERRRHAAPTFRLASATTGFFATMQNAGGKVGFRSVRVRGRDRLRRGRPLALSERPTRNGQSNRVGCDQAAPAPNISMANPCARKGPLRGSLPAIRGPEPTLDLAPPAREHQDRRLKQTSGR